MHLLKYSSLVFADQHILFIHVEVDSTQRLFVPFVRGQLVADLLLALEDVVDCGDVAGEDGLGDLVMLLCLRELLFEIVQLLFQLIGRERAKHVVLRTCFHLCKFGDGCARAGRI